MSDASFADPVPDYRADLVVLTGPLSAPQHGLVAEAQLRLDREKAFRWPYYVAGLQMQLRCPVDLLVVTPSAAVAAWAARIGVGESGLRLQPIVIGPDELPLITDPERVRAQPDLAVLAAMAHGRRPASAEALLGVMDALGGLERSLRSGYLDLVWAALGAATRQALEALMPTKDRPYLSDKFNELYARGAAEGKAEGKAEAILAVLEGRGLRASAEQAERVRSTADLALLDTWLGRVLAVRSVEELLEGAKRRP